MSGQRIRELIAPLGSCGGRTIVDDYLREIHPFFVTLRTYQRTVYRPGESCQFDLWEPKAEVPGRAWPAQRRANAALRVEMASISSGSTSRSTAR